MYESKRTSAHKTIEKKDSKLKEIEAVSHSPPPWLVPLGVWLVSLGVWLVSLGVWLVPMRVWLVSFGNVARACGGVVFDAVCVVNDD